MMFLFLFSFMALAEFETCTVMDEKGTAYMTEVDGPCASVGAPWNNGKYVLVQSAEKQNKKARMDRLKKACAGQAGLLKELCDEITAGK